jgi:two-component system, chemotaxis family, chemotaxis protein CheY
MPLKLMGSSALVAAPPEDAQVLRGLLDAVGMVQVFPAHDGQQAWRKLIGDEPVDLAIVHLDLLPDSGLGLIDRLRRLGPAERQWLPVLLVGAQDRLPNVVTARLAGINEVLSMPIVPRLFYERLVAILSDREGLHRYVGSDRRFAEDPGYEGPERRVGY